MGILSSKPPRRKSPKKCRCGETDQTQFYQVIKRGRPYLKNICIACDKARQAKWQIANSEKYAARQAKWREKNPHYQRKKRYNLSEQEFLSMLEAQGGVCKICFQSPAEGKPLQVDHCHKTGKVRGLLCYTCNHTLMQFKEDVSRFRRAADYLEQ